MTYALRAALLLAGPEATAQEKWRMFISVRHDLQQIWQEQTAFVMLHRIKEQLARTLQLEDPRDVVTTLAGHDFVGPVARDAIEIIQTAEEADHFLRKRSSQ